MRAVRSSIALPPEPAAAFPADFLAFFVGRPDDMVGGIVTGWGV